MARARVRMLEAGDVAHIAANLRPADSAELAALFGPFDAQEVISRSVMVSSEYWVLATDEPLALFGVAPISLMGGDGAPWLLGTEETARHSRALVSDGRRYVRRMLALYPHLYNYVDARNERSIGWLRRLGFTIHAPAPFGVAGLPFHRFELKA